jgi:glycosyltransferase involved in cell wall biosynthesis
VVINGRFLLNSFGGARRFAVELTERLARLRGDILLVTPPLPEGTSVPDVPHRTVGRFGGPAWEQIELPLWLRAHGRPLLLNPATIAPFLYSRQISVVHDIAPAMRPQDFTPLFRVQWHLAVRLGMLRRGQRLVTISRASQREIAEQFGIDPARIDVVYAGADSFVASERPSIGAAVAPTFLVFGRHGAAKNIRTVLDAARALPDESGINVRLIGQLDPALKPYAEEKRVPEERLDWQGPVTDSELAQGYREAVGFIWPSLHEGFGIPPVEAQSLGVPVIASDIPINREVLGDAALYFPAEEPAALASAMVELVADRELRASLSARGMDNARRFTWDHTAAGWDELIRRDQG